MSFLFGGGGGGSSPAPTPKPATPSTPEPTPTAMPQGRAPIGRMSTMLAQRRRGEDEARPTVGTKTLLGQ